MGMNMEGIERSELLKLQKEQQRERRRLRDRQRRQSMSVEERERHLARRRRNYQLRRLRAENSKLDSDQTQSEQMTAPSQELLALPSVSSNLDVGSHTVCTQFESLEVPAHELAKFSGQLRLNRLKHLARSMNDTVSDSNRVMLDVTIKGNEDSGISQKGLRLNHVKHLARSLNSAVQETPSQNHPSQVEDTFSATATYMGDMTVTLTKSILIEDTVNAIIDTIKESC